MISNSKPLAQEEHSCRGSFAASEVENAIVGIVGLGYVGYPLAREFAKHNRVVAFDINSAKIDRLVRDNDCVDLTLTDKAEELRQADFIVIAVPTPTTKSNEPDLSFLEEACRIVRRHLKPGATVISESTVYPGVTEDVLKLILEESGLQCGKDFRIAYCPERMNPGDTEHSLTRVTKVVSGMDHDTTEMVAALYSRICPSVFKATDIRTAEAAKVIENIQRDLNIALANELALIFDRLGLRTRDVLEAASTKWNFVRYSPGLVGGHCIPVDPHYLVYKAKEVGYVPQVILAGRATNDYMSIHVARLAIKALNTAGKVIGKSRVLIMGLTYKENVPDTRKSPATGVIGELREYGVQILGFDPLVPDLHAQFGIEEVGDLESVRNVDCIVMTVVHDSFGKLSLGQLRRLTGENPILVDVRGFFDPDEAQDAGFSYRTL